MILNTKQYIYSYLIIIIAFYVIYPNFALEDQKYNDNNESITSSGNHLKPYAYYVFASEWAGSVCQYNFCRKTYLDQIDPKFFNIHGLWPTTTDGEDPDKCKKLPFSKNLIYQNTSSQLKCKWSGLFADSNIFYAHEWEKHGRCWDHHPLVGNQFSAKGSLINDFFETVVYLASQINLYSTFEKYGIVPSDDQQYSIGDFEKALAREFNTTHAIIKCIYNSHKFYITSVYLCLDLEYKVISCPVSVVRRIPVSAYIRECGNEVYLPVLKLE